MLELENRRRWLPLEAAVMFRRMVQWSTCSSRTAEDVVGSWSLQMGHVRYFADVKENDEGGSGDERLNEEIEMDDDPRRRIIVGEREGEGELDRE